MAIVELDGGHTPLEMVHCKIFVPNVIPLTTDVGELTVKTELPPVKTVQLPVPITGVFPDKVALDAHKVCVGPALDKVGKASR